jgi:transposase-like protein
VSRLTFTRDTGKISETREISDGEKVEKNREMRCPYCASDNLVKRGKRQKKHETVQLYLCKDCNRTFTDQSIKGRRFPLTVIIEAMTLYNLGNNLREVRALIRQKFAIEPKESTISDWINEYADLCRYERLRPYIMKVFTTENLVEEVTMAHKQLYRFRYHRGKMAAQLEEIKHRNLKPLRDFLEDVPAETPHQYFEKGIRISDVRSKFDKSQMIVKGKHNYANELAAFVLPTVRNSKERHEAVQRFFLTNDSVTVATEVPVYITQESIEHLENQLDFKVIGEEGIRVRKGESEEALKKNTRLLLTGHIDILQVRNGVVHILDYKPQAHREKPIEQLTWYAMALSRLTGLRIYNFKCAWFDEREYYEFYPLHVVYKLRQRRRRTVKFRSGQRAVIPEEDRLTAVARGIWREVTRQVHVSRSPPVLSVWEDLSESWSRCAGG